MFSRDISSNRWIPLVLMMVFMLFATPTPGLEVSAGESARTSMSHGMEFFLPPTKRLFGSTPRLPKACGLQGISLPSLFCCLL